MENDRVSGNPINEAERLLSSSPFSEEAGEELIGTGRDSIVSIFERVASANPDKIAVVCGDESWTYGFLNSCANHVADHLRDLGVRADSFVAIYLDRSPEMMLGLLGILKAGGAYLPIDSTYPQARVLEVLGDAKPLAILTTASLGAGLADTIAGLQVTVIDIGDIAAKTPKDLENPPLAARADDLAYMIYTSGSTGKPKGVMVTHRNVVRLLTHTEQWFHFNSNDVWTMFHSIAFDFSVWEIWGCLLHGGRLVIVPFDVSRSPQDFYRLLSAQKVSVLNQTPSAFFLLMNVEENTVPLPLSLRLIIFGGEALQYRKLAPWFRRHDDAKPQLVNMYGITETTVHVTYRAIKAGEAESVQESLIGEPIPDMQIHLLDVSGEPVKNGETGEIYVGGGGVSRGYHNRAQLSQERFIADTFVSSPGGRLYRTGDLARLRADGEMVYVGRNDSQVKINGFRIELGEVEATMAAVPGVRQSCVIVQTDRNGVGRLAVYFVASPGADPEAELTANFLGRFFAERLPAHMRPSSYTALKELPLTANGKLDASALPPASSVPRQSSPEAVAVESISETEQRVARIFLETLGLQRIGLDDNFFDCGGTSLLLIQSHGFLQAKFERPIPVTLMFECPTVRSLSQRLSAEGPRSLVMSAFQQQARKTRAAYARARAGKSVAS